MSLCLVVVVAATHRGMLLGVSVKIAKIGVEEERGKTAAQLGYLIFVHIFTHFETSKFYTQKCVYLR